MVGLEAMQKAHMIYSNNLGEFDEKTKEVEDTLIKVESRFKDAQDQWWPKYFDTSFLKINSK